MTTRSGLNRRRWLRGAGSVTVGLPLLDVFEPRPARGASDGRSPFVAIVVNANGVMQMGETNKILMQDPTREPEMFWPTAAGPLTKAGLEADRPKRALGELSEYAERLLVVRGVSHTFARPLGGCGHAYSNAQLLTATAPNGSGPECTASGESVDSRIAREKNAPGREPLTLHAGQRPPGGKEYDAPGYMSYIASAQPRVPDPSPLSAYQRMMGLASSDATGAKAIGDRRSSVNDLLRLQMKRLLARSDLSSNDRLRLDQHFTAIRDLEVKLGASELPATSIAAMQKVDPMPYAMANHEQIIRLHVELMVLALSSDYTRVATLRIGDRGDGHVFDRIDPTDFHSISHRNGGDPINHHNQIDRIHAGFYRELLDRLAAIDTPTGNFLDQGVAVWTNELATGAHAWSPIPWVLAGSAGGLLKKGLFINPDQEIGGDNGDSAFFEGKGKFPTNRMLNSLLMAAAVRKANGDPVDDFGDPGLPRGVLSELFA